MVASNHAAHRGCREGSSSHCLHHGRQQEVCCREQHERLTWDEEGFFTLNDMCECAIELGVEHITVYAFSLENFRRPRDQVDALMDAAHSKLTDETWLRDFVLKKGVRIDVIGDLSRAPPEVCGALQRVVDQTKDNDRLHLHVAFCYSSTAELDAARRAYREASRCALPEPPMIGGSGDKTDGCCAGGCEEGEISYVNPGPTTTDGQQASQQPSCSDCSDNGSSEATADTATAADGGAADGLDGSSGCSSASGPAATSTAQQGLRRRRGGKQPTTTSLPATTATPTTTGLAGVRSVDEDQPRCARDSPSPSSTPLLGPQSVAHSADLDYTGRRRAFETHLWTAPTASPDILIRTSGETRLSDFLVWQVSEKTDFYFMKDLWPCFGPWRLISVVLHYQLAQMPARGGWFGSSEEMNGRRENVRQANMVNVCSLLLLLRRRLSIHTCISSTSLRPSPSACEDRQGRVCVLKGERGDGRYPWMGCHWGGRCSKADSASPRLFCDDVFYVVHARWWPGSRRPFPHERGAEPVG
eukprot:GHVU01036089.1.p1 GENE.GHVU01036089.1~~GHVU01036089.1.p1  ORF type:complete len:529 (+),score=74.19 GHVU01036089.1:698-2284(+)